MWVKFSYKSSLGISLYSAQVLIKEDVCVYQDYVGTEWRGSQTCQVVAASPSTVKTQMTISNVSSLPIWNEVFLYHHCIH